jgi:hypothetical protein
MHKNFLKIDLVNQAPEFAGFFESRVKNLRERIENSYLQIQDQQMIDQKNNRNKFVPPV